MPRTATRRFGATAGLLCGAAASSALAAALVARTVTLVPDGGALRVEELVALAVTAAGAAVAGWLALSTATALVCVLARLLGATWRTGEALVTRIAPAMVRRAVAATVVAGLGVSLATGAQAAVPGAPDVTEAAASTTAAAATVDVGWHPTAVGDHAAEAGLAPTNAAPADDEAVDTTWRPTRLTAGAPSTAAAGSSGGTQSPHADVQPSVVPDTSAPAQTPAAVTTLALATTASSPPGSPAAAPSADVVEVRPGDTLWSIAAEHLPDGADAGDVAAAWPTWYQANRDVIGDDPDRLQPGQRLQPPTTRTSDSASASTSTSTDTPTAPEAH